jgi:pimeloyl-ACP methyl ester carboxylesterase
VTTMQRPGGRSGIRAGGTAAIADHERIDEVRASFLRLAERFQPEAAKELDAAYVVDIDGRSSTTIHVRAGRCLVSPGANDRAVARFGAAPGTWLDLVDGRCDGIAAFLQGRLTIEGDLNLAARFETLFRPAPGGGRVLRTHHTSVKGVTLESMVTGEGPPVLLLHGLGASKVSFFPTLDGLADRFEVHALDLPGFGRSEKPLPTGRRYSMAWFADMVNGYLVERGIGDAHVIGNSMGGRISVELALRHHRSVRSVVTLGSAVAFDEYQRLGPLLRLGQPHWVGVAPLPIPAARLERMVRNLVEDLFHDPTTVPSDNHRAAAAEAVASLRDPGYRLALLASARRLGAERADGRQAFWSKLERLAVPSYWIFGRSDRLVSSRYATQVSRVLPSAVVDVWDAVGHVPQFEVPERTNDAVRAWLDRIEAGR